MEALHSWFAFTIFLQFYIVPCMFHENQGIEVTTLRVDGMHMAWFWLVP
jgi:hypothetical protein